jgi:phosphocarrier protein HPr
MHAEKQIVLKNKLGLHARPSASLVKLASTFQSDIWLEANERTANAKSIMSVMVLAAQHGTPLTFRAEGPDAQAAVEALTQLADKQFSEEDFL